MNCVKCGNEIPERRLKALPGTRVCVNCSSTQPVKAIITVIGEGDHTATDIQIVSNEEFQKLEKLKHSNSKSKIKTSFEEEENTNFNDVKDKLNTDNES